MRSQVQISAETKQTLGKRAEAKRCEALTLPKPEAIEVKRSSRFEGRNAEAPRCEERLRAIAAPAESTVGFGEMVMAISESSRLCASLKKEDVPVKRLIANQEKLMVEASQDQSRALDMIQNDQELSSLMLVQAPLVGVVEINKGFVLFTHYVKIYVLSGICQQTAFMDYERLSSFDGSCSNY
ncbi:hypothetical protein RND71_024998 [Anisodus tanguticus]|uniref:Uncharacterized protein n=1 Tax=Anisodus tanguticus TaxID=243964 RepID=A0AAE1RS86_9SOLA|nr:hypothetical protein RND71_024998 [Anisodus tanguticus]